MTIQTRGTVLLTGALFALGGCDGAPVAPQTEAAETLSHVLARSESATRMRCTNNLKQIGMALNDRSELGLIAHDPSVDVDLGEDGRAPGAFFGHLVAEPDGGGCGEAQIEFATGGVFADGSVRFIIDNVLIVPGEREPLVLTFAGEAELCPGSDAPCVSARLIGEVRVTEPEGLWRLQLPHARESGGPLDLEFTARTYLIWPGQGAGEERLTLCEGPTSIWRGDEELGWARLQLTGRIGTAAVSGSFQIRLGTTQTYTVRLGLLLREGDGFRWLLQGDVVEAGDRAPPRFFYSEVVLRSGSGFEEEDSWSVQEARYQWYPRGFQILDVS